MFGSVCVEGKKFQFSGGGGGAFPFRLTKLSRRKRFFVSLCLEELRWLSVEWVRFCTSKGDPIWVKTFRWKNRFWLLLLRKNFNGRYITLSNFSDSGHSRSIIFPEGPKADGWFSVGKLVKELLIEANKPLPKKKHSTPRYDSTKVNGPPTFANAVKNSVLKGWRCRTCGSWDIFAAVIGDLSGDTKVDPQPKMQECSPMGPKESTSCSQMNIREEARGVDRDKQTDSNSSADCVSVSPVLFNFHVLRTLRETYPCSWLLATRMGPRR